MTDVVKVPTAAETLKAAYDAAVAGLAPADAARQIAHIKLIANMSPSGVGDYAACPLKAVFDAEYPRIEKPQFKCYSDFGKICHWQAQYMIGGATLKDKPPQAEWDSARQTPDVPSTPANFVARVEQCATLANTVVKDATPLPAGVSWRAKGFSARRVAAPVWCRRRGPPTICGCFWHRGYAITKCGSRLHAGWRSATFGCRWPCQRC
jgi:hypothetical protein